MSKTVVVETLEQLKPYLNDNHVMEIVQRGKNKKCGSLPGQGTMHAKTTPPL